MKAILHCSHGKVSIGECEICTVKNIRMLNSYEELVLAAKNVIKHWEVISGNQRIPFSGMSMLCDVLGKAIAKAESGS